MGLFEHFPYTNFHDLNLDWIIGKTKQAETKVAELDTKVDGIDDRLTIAESDIEDHEERIDALEDQDVTKSYVDAQDTATLNSAKAYADNKDAATLVSAKNYADTQDTATLNVAKAYADAQDVSNLNAAKTYAKDYTDTVVPDGGLTGQVLTKRSGTDQDTQWAYSSVIPQGGTAGQALIKNSSTEGDLGWGNVTPEGVVPVARLIPQGGQTGAALVKTSSSDYAVGWGDPTGGVPEGGTTGQILAKASGTDFDTTWVTDHNVPSGGTTGQVLMKESASDYDANWNDLPIGYSNRNLIDNPFFTINQRRVTSGNLTTLAYFLDRWMGENCATVIGTGLGFAWDGINGSKGRLVQRIEKGLNLTGKVVIMSAIIDNTLYKWSFTYPVTGDLSYSVSADFDFKITIDTNYDYIEIDTTDTVSHNIKAVKLEIGAISTLANDTTPNYAEELAKCQSYCYNPLLNLKSSDPYAAIGTVILRNNETAATGIIYIPIMKHPLKMRLEVTGTYQCFGASGGVPVSNFTMSRYSGNTLLLIITLSAPHTTTETEFLRTTSSDCSFIISADL